MTDKARHQDLQAVDGWIEVRGARTHNLKNVDVKVPRASSWFSRVFQGVENPASHLIRFTLKGNVDTSRASPPTRDILGQMKKPDCDSIEGLSPGNQHRSEAR